MCKQNSRQEDRSPAYDKKLPNEIVAHYEQGDEIQRLSSSLGQLEGTRMRELITRHLPETPAVVYDVGGGPGGYACWLARRGYEVHLVDPVPLHVEQASAASQDQPDHPLAELRVGDARHLDRADNSVDVVLMLGPLIPSDRTKRANRGITRIVSNPSERWNHLCCRYFSICFNFTRYDTG